MKLKACQFEYVFPRPLMVMGIVNVTPDSFSDGGCFADPAAAIDHALKLVEEGAEVIDVGGESTRPQATPVPEAEELRRVLPVVEGLCAQTAIPISIDTMKPGVARAAVAAGAVIVNDVAANREERTMWELVAQTGVAYVCVHMQGTPQTMQANPAYRNVVDDVAEFFRERMARLIGCGVREDQIILDPGIGFGKTVEHNLQLLAGLPRQVELSRPLAVGVSRKSFIASLAGGPREDRLPGALACACLAVQAGVSILRVHDVAATCRAVRMTEAILARRPCGC